MKELKEFVDFIAENKNRKAGWWSSNPGDLHFQKRLLLKIWNSNQSCLVENIPATAINGCTLDFVVRHLGPVETAYSIRGQSNTDCIEFDSDAGDGYYSSFSLGGTVEYIPDLSRSPSVLHTWKTNVKFGGVSTQDTDIHFEVWALAVDSGDTEMRRKDILRVEA